MSKLITIKSISPDQNALHIFQIVNVFYPAHQKWRKCTQKMWSDVLNFVRSCFLFTSQFNQYERLTRWHLWQILHRQNISEKLVNVIESRLKWYRLQWQWIRRLDFIYVEWNLQYCRIFTLGHWTSSTVSWIDWRSALWCLFIISHWHSFWSNANQSYLVALVIKSIYVFRIIIPSIRSHGWKWSEYTIFCVDFFCNWIPMWDYFISIIWRISEFIADEDYTHKSTISNNIEAVLTRVVKSMCFWSFS